MIAKKRAGGQHASHKGLPRSWALRSLKPNKMRSCLGSVVWINYNVFNAKKSLELKECSMNLLETFLPIMCDKCVYIRG